MKGTTTSPKVILVKALLLKKEQLVGTRSINNESGVENQIRKFKQDSLDKRNHKEPFSMTSEEIKEYLDKYIGD